MKVAILTVSDKGAAGQREDLSGAEIAAFVQKQNGQTLVRDIVPDERQLIAAKLQHYADNLKVDVVFTTGGTGFSPRDWTPEATKDVIEREAPGLAEAMRAASLKVTPHAMLSRAVAGIRKKTLIINLPGSPKGVRENLAVIQPALAHALEILSGHGGECGHS